MSTLYVVRRERCGCLVSTRPARDQARPMGEAHPHSDGSVSITMPVETAAVVPETCPACRDAGLHRGRHRAHAVSAEDYMSENRDL